MTCALIELGGRVLGLDLASAIAKSRRYGHRFVSLLGDEAPAGLCGKCDRFLTSDGFCPFCDHVEGETDPEN